MTSSKKSNTKHLTKVYDSFEGIGQELQFLNSVLAFLNKKSKYLAKPGISKQVLQIVHNAIDNAKKKEIREQKLNQKKKAAAATTVTVTDTDTKMKDKKETQPETNSNTNSNNDNKEQPNKTKQSDNKEEDEDSGPAPIGNGGDTGRYVWTQTLSQVEVTLPIDKKLRGKNLNIQMKSDHLFVCIRGQESEPLMDGTLHSSIDVSDSSWMLDQEYGKNTKTLTLVLKKITGMSWWSRVIVGDPEIDTKLIQPENSKLHDLDGETRQTVQKMMFDQRQKAKGLPTSKELEQRKMLEKFKAQHPEMDFSKVKFG